jgi:hypothetical protein
MPSFGGRAVDGSMVIGILCILALVVVVAYTVWPSNGPQCPAELRRNAHGEFRLHPSGQDFSTMQEFQNWWYSSGMNIKCPIPVLTGVKEKIIMDTGDYTEQTYAKTPINKVDDYEFSRIFGHERGGKMVIDREDYNKIIHERNTDWVDKPYSSDERRKTYKGLEEGFTAEGDLTSDAVARYGEVVVEEHGCKLDREEKDVARMVARAYESDPAWEPVVTRVGPHHWEVNELKPKRHFGEIEEAGKDQVFDPANSDVEVGFRYRQQEVINEALDPYYRSTGDLESERSRDRYDGVVPGMERMFGPTLDKRDWTNSHK